jgi:hypothetical protein
MKVVHIPTDIFNRMVKELCAEGWRKTEEYDNFDAWIDYGMVVLQKGGNGLRFEWDNWMEGQLTDQMRLFSRFKADTVCRDNEGLTMCCSQRRTPDLVCRLSSLPCE